MEVDTRTTLIAGIVVGLVLGLLLGAVLFWWLFPVTWTDANSYDLSPEAKAEYVALVADSYMLDRDYANASELLELWTAE
jgi:predicted lysophospholipase L1 biosynthesis ABC-type transport system permease subunit